MGRSLLFLICMLVVVLVSPRGAQAGIPIPCVGERLVLVRTLPKDARVQTRHGLVHIDLGYVFSGCTDGKWVGYAGDGTYYDVPQAALSVIAFRAGLNGLPPAPSYLFTWSASWPLWVWTAAIMLGGAGAMVRSRRMNASKFAAAGHAHEPVADASPPPSADPMPRAAAMAGSRRRWDPRRGAKNGDPHRSARRVAA